ncbi:MAG: hypothetical protein OXJ62_16695 [Spirochaetaceae bacterium]|nr:hypothetical protein [Spirochaetaceae bacterium]
MSTIRRSGKQPVACGALVALACLALASCSGGPGAARPDLVVESPKVNDHRPAAGAGFTFSATVRNAGRGSAAATTLRVYRSDDDAAITPAGEQVGAAAVPALAASASGVASVTVTAPSSPGTSYYRACADPVAGESDPANNCSATVRVDVQARNLEPASPRPDLVVESPAVSDASPVAGASFSFSATVRNAGGGNAAATTLRVYRSDDETITPADEQVGAATVPALAASESSPASMELSAPSSSGTYYYGACVHAAAEESDTANNCSAPVQVTVQAPQVAVSEPPRPDLTLDGPWVDNANPALGGVFQLSAEVHLHGTPKLVKATLRFYHSTDATITRSDTQVATRERWLGTLTQNWEAYQPVWVKAPSSKGTYYYGACVDETAGESDTTNNCSEAVTVKVSHNKPDLRVGSWAVWLPRPAGESIRVAMAVSNRGSPSEATTLRLLLLPDRKSAPSEGTQVAEVDVPELAVTKAEPAKSLRYVEFQAPAAGRYYYVACVDAVARESDTTNNCSWATPIEFR